MTAQAPTSQPMQLVAHISLWSPGLCLVTITLLILHTHSFIHHRLYIILATDRIVNTHTKKNSIMYHATCNFWSNDLVGAHSILECTDRSHIQRIIITYSIPSIVHIAQIKIPCFKGLQFIPGDHTHHINHYISQNSKIIWWEQVMSLYKKTNLFITSEITLKDM